MENKTDVHGKDMFPPKGKNAAGISYPLTAADVYQEG